MVPDAAVAGVQAGGHLARHLVRHTNCQLEAATRIGRVHRPLDRRAPSEVVNSFDSFHFVAV